MRPKDLTDVQRITDLLETGTATRRDMVALLILMRGQLSKTDQPMLLDISHCVAHSKRDRGMAYEYIKDFLESFIKFAQRGGAIKVGVLFPIKIVLNELNTALNNAGIHTHSEKILESQADHIENLLKDILDGIELAELHPDVLSCSFETGISKQGEKFSFIVSFNDSKNANVIKLRSSVKMGFPVFR